MTKKTPVEVSIGKFDILATYSYAKALAAGDSDDDAKQRGLIAAIMGANARRGETTHKGDDFASEKEQAERKKKTTITAEAFDHQVADKMGGFFAEVFLPAMKDAVADGLSYAEVKLIVRIPTTWGAKITGSQFNERWQKASKRKGGGSAHA